ncbi:hypothetical protein Tco_0122570 [Tanacetum coccineum]
MLIRVRGKKAYKKRQPAVNLDDDDDDDVNLEARTNIRWTNAEEKLLAETFVEVSQNAAIGNDQTNEAFWSQITDDFNGRTNRDARTKNMITGKWTRINGECQKFNAIYKHLQRKSGENEHNHIENAKASFADHHEGRKFAYLHAW